MSNNQYTQKSMETIQLAQRLAQERGHQQLEQAHLLSALLNLLLARKRFGEERSGGIRT